MSKRKSPWQRLEEKLIYIRSKPRKQKHIPETEITTYDHVALLLKAQWDRTRSRRVRNGTA